MENENNGKTVLVVDDSEVMREMIKDSLKDKGYIIAGEAKDGDEALVRYKEYEPTVVTMDVVMPSTHGIDAIKTIIEHDPKARIVVISGLHQKSLVMDALDAGARDYIIKPFEPDDLISAIERSITG
ncbi:MAG: response regulator [Thermoplasmata archaeon]|nr:response regulator [Thermoplasmata archaeon]